MHRSVMEWGERMVREHDLSGRSAFEIGSLNVNGSLRGLFSGPYVGVDRLPGPGVDQIADANTLPFEARQFDVVVCTEVLAHDARFWLTIGEAFRVLRWGGSLLLTVRGLGFGRNDSPSDYYRFTPEAVRSLLTDAGFADLDVSEDPMLPGVLALARKTVATVGAR